MNKYICLSISKLPPKKIVELHFKCSVDSAADHEASFDSW